jgi:hypothetical protein
VISSLLRRQRYGRRFPRRRRDSRPKHRRGCSAGYEHPFAKVEYQPHDTGLILFHLLPQQQNKTAVLAMDPDGDVSACGSHRPLAPKAFAHDSAAARQSGATMVSGPDGRLVSFSSAALPHQTRAALSAWTGGYKGTHNNSTSCASSPSSNRSTAAVSARHAPPHRSVSSGGMTIDDMAASGFSGYGPADHVLPPHSTASGGGRVEGAATVGLPKLDRLRSQKR